MKIVVQGQEFEVQPGADSISVGGTDYPVRIVRQGEIITVYVNERPYQVQLTAAAAEGPAEGLGGAKEDEGGGEGGVLGAREERKMESGGRAPAAGTVKEVAVAAGARVSEGDLLVILETAE